MTMRPSQMDRQTFLETYGSIYEHSPWVAEGVWDDCTIRQLDEPEMMVDRMARVMLSADPARQLDLIRAHPDLADRTGIAAPLTESSRREQNSAGLDRCSAEEFERFQVLNEEYRRRFGFPFIIAVSGLDRAAILAEFESRVSNDRDTEFAMALEQINRIARLRLQAS